MDRIHKFQRTYEQTDHLDNVIGSAEVRFTYSVHWGSPATGQFGPPEHYDPGSGDEITITKVEVEAYDGGTHWRPASPDEAERYSEWAHDDLEDDMIEEAADREISDAEAAAEMRAA